MRGIFTYIRYIIVPISAACSKLSYDMLIFLCIEDKLSLVIAVSYITVISRTLCVTGGFY